MAQPLQTSNTKNDKSYRFQDAPPSGQLSPISVDNVPLVSFKEALDPIRDRMVNLDGYADTTTQRVQEKFANGPPDGISVDEVSAINLYTREWTTPEDSLYFKLNSALRTENRTEVKPFLHFLKLLLTALSKLHPSDPNTETRTLWRGTRGDISGEYEPKKKFWWWGFSSCSPDVSIATSFLRESNQSRVLWNIHSSSPVFNISAFSVYPDETEVLLLPGRHLEVITLAELAPGLTIIELKEISSSAPMLTGVNFLGAKLSSSTPSLLEQKKITGFLPTPTFCSTKQEIFEACRTTKPFIIAPHITALNLGLSDIGEDEAQRLSEVLKSNSTLTEISLYNTKITDDGIRHLSEALKWNNTLTNIGLGLVKIGVKTYYLSEALKLNNTIKTINLRETDIEDNGVWYISEALKSNNGLTTINLSYNKIREIGVRHISEALKSNNTLRTINLAGNDIGDNGTRYLCEALKLNNTLTEIDLSFSGLSMDLDSNIGEVGAQYLSEVLKLNSTLTTINLCANSIEDNGARYLSEALKYLKAINLGGNGIGDNGAQHLSEALKLNNTLISISLYGNKIGENGALHLSEALKSNNTLTSIDLQRNDIGDNGIQHFCEALQSNNTLKSFDLGESNITDVGAQCLSKVLKLNSTLTTINLCDNSIGENGARYLSEAFRSNNTLTSVDLKRNRIGNNGAQHLREALKTKLSNTLKIDLASQRK